MRYEYGSSLLAGCGCRFASVSQGATDRVRNYPIGNPDITLTYFEEVFTSEYWMTRIYRVLPEPPREAQLPYAAAQGIDRVKKALSAPKRRGASGLPE